MRWRACGQSAQPPQEPPNDRSVGGGGAEEKENPPRGGLGKGERGEPTEPTEPCSLTELFCVEVAQPATSDFDGCVSCTAFPFTFSYRRRWRWSRRRWCWRRCWRRWCWRRRFRRRRLSDILGTLHFAVSPSAIDVVPAFDFLDFSPHFYSLRRTKP